MIFYVLEFQEAIRILRKLGVKIKKPKNFIKKNYNYYASITTHGSTLSKFIHNAILSNLKQENHMVWKWFKNALESDIYDSQRGTTKEGIHCGLMAGTIEIVRKYFAGIKTHKKGLALKPWLPAHWKKLKFRIKHQKKEYLFDFALEKRKLKIIFEKGSGESSIEYQRKKHPLKKSKIKSIKLKKCHF
jgi:trehalose/maltose hydrolase-like predicted phosphorylase